MKTKRASAIVRAAAWLAPLLAVAALGMGDSPKARKPERPGGERVVIRKAVDGDTARLDDGTLVRYIGIDTPEMRRREGDRWVKDPEPLAQDATEANRRLVEGREAVLEADVEPQDRYGRRLAYVYVDGQMVNERLLRDGFAKLLTIPPNVKHIERLKAAQAEAKEGHRGVWSSPGALERD